MGARFDHLVVSVPDLPAAIERWSATGLPVQPGGRHPGGTINALVRGPQAAYVELISTEPDADSPWAERVRSLRGPLGFAVAVADIAVARAALVDAGFSPNEITDGSRVTPDGSLVRWRLCQVGERAFDPHLPFLIEWLEPMPPAPDDGPVLESVNVETPHRDRLVAMLRAVGLREEPADVPWTTFFDGEVRITLSPTSAEMAAWEQSRGGAAAVYRFEDDTAGRDERTPIGPTSISLGRPVGAPTWHELDGLHVNIGPDIRSHVGHVLLPAVEVHFSARPAELARWPPPHPGRAPLEEEYSRCPDPGKYRILAARARAWASTLSDRGIAHVTEAEGRIEVSPHRTGALPIRVRLTGFEGVADNAVEILAGDVVLSRLPDCGCDACDDGSASLLQALDEVFLHVLDGGVLQVRGPRGIVVRTTLDGWSADGNVEAREVDRWIADARAGRSRYAVTEGDPWL